MKVLHGIWKDSVDLLNLSLWGASLSMEAFLGMETVVGIRGKSAPPCCSRASKFSATLVHHRLNTRFSSITPCFLWALFFLKLFCNNMYSANPWLARKFSAYSALLPSPLVFLENRNQTEETSENHYSILPRTVVVHHRPVVKGVLRSGLVELSSMVVYPIIIP